MTAPNQQITEWAVEFDTSDRELIDFFFSNGRLTLREITPDILLSEDSQIKGTTLAVYQDYLVVASKYTGVSGSVFLLKNNEFFTSIAMTRPRREFGAFIWID